jgi:hypothetical protein
VVNALDPHAGTAAGGTAVNVYGSGFAGATAVYLASTYVPFSVVDDSHITVSDMPAGTIGKTLDLRVTNPSGVSAKTAADRYTFAAPGIPLVDAVDPDTGSSSGGTTVTLHGVGFSRASAVHFGSVKVTGFYVSGDNTLTVFSSPKGSAGVRKVVTVTTAGGVSSASAASTFLYTTAAPPIVHAVTPNTGSADGFSDVTILGASFTGTKAVKFGGKAATYFSVQGNGTIAAGVPPGRPGTGVDVVVTTGGGSSAKTSADMYTYAPLATGSPLVSAIDPSQGPAAGGTSVTIYGSGFTATTVVDFGTVAASYYVGDDMHVYATSPAGVTGSTVDVRVTTSVGTSSISSVDLFSYTGTSQVVLSGLYPASGPAAGGAQVAISGSGFTNATEVDFGGFPAQNLTVSDDNDLTAIAPAGSLGSTVDVTVFTQAGSSPAGPQDRFTYTSTPVPSVTGISPASGSQYGGTSVTIYGRGLTSVGSVTFGSSAAETFTVNSDYSITALSPPGPATNAVHIVVATPAGSSSTSGADLFTYAGGPVTAPPTVTAVSPNVAPASCLCAPNYYTYVWITGTGFAQVSGVKFSGSEALTYQVISDTLIQVATPYGGSGTYDLVVFNPAGPSAISGVDQYTTGPTPSGPIVSGLDPPSAPADGGAYIEIYGAGLANASAVDFGSTPSAQFSSSDSAVAAQVPAGTAGDSASISVVVGGMRSAGGPQTVFTYAATPAPRVMALSATEGYASGGASIAIYGTGFLNATAVSFGGFTANLFFVSDYEISVSIPPAQTGTVDITVTTPGGTSTHAPGDQFTYLSTPAPTVTAVSPSTGRAVGGQPIDITGTGFNVGSAITVSFDGGQTQTSAYALVDTLVQVVSPAGPSSGGTLDLLVTTVGGTSAITSADRYTFEPAPVPAVSGVSPASGSAAGGQLIYVSGAGLSGATTVSVGGSPASNLSSVSDHLVEVTTPPGTAGATADVTVTTSGGTSPISQADRYGYTTPPAPVVTAVSPSSGPADATGGPVYVSGSGFTGATAVTVGGTSEPFGVYSDNVIYLSSPPGGIAGNSVDVAVTTAGGTSSGAAADRYSYTTNPPPTVTAIGPTSGSSAGGQVVYVAGSQLGAATAVAFGGSALPANSWRQASDGLIEVVQSVPGPSGTSVDITVTTPGGTSPPVTGDRFTFVPAATPAISSVSPTHGPAAGGTLIYVAGSGLSGATVVDFGSVPGAQVAVIDDGLITVRSPAGTATTSASLTVTAPGGTSAPSSTTFTWQ